MPLEVSHYDRLIKIGQGTYGIVYKARDKKTKSRVALKRMLMDDDQEGIPSTVMREIALLKQLDHPNIAKLQSIFFENEKSGSLSTDLYLVFDLCTSDFKKYMNKFRHTPMHVKKVQRYMYQMLDGLSFCHSKSILHRDIKPQNILIDEATDTVKLTDFGLSRTYLLPQRKLTKEVITLWYRPPELLLGCRSYSIGVDIWSMGAVLAEILNNSEPLFRGNSEVSQLMHIFIKCGTPNRTNWPSVYDMCDNFQHANKFPQWKRQAPKSFCSRTDFKREGGLDLLDRMLLLDPFSRITAKEALNHEFFSSHTSAM